MRYICATILSYPLGALCSLLRAQGDLFGFVTLYVLIVCCFPLALTYTLSPTRRPLITHHTGMNGQSRSDDAYWQTPQSYTPQLVVRTTEASYLFSVERRRYSCHSHNHDSSSGAGGAFTSTSTRSDAFPSHFLDTDAVDVSFVHTDEENQRELLRAGQQSTAHTFNGTESGHVVTTNGHGAVREEDKGLGVNTKGRKIMMVRQEVIELVEQEQLVENLAALDHSNPAAVRSTSDKKGMKTKTGTVTVEKDLNNVKDVKDGVELKAIAAAVELFLSAHVHTHGNGNGNGVEDTSARKSTSTSSNNNNNNRHTTAGTSTSTSTSTSTTHQPFLPSLLRGFSWTCIPLLVGPSEGASGTSGAGMGEDVAVHPSPTRFMVHVPSWLALSSASADASADSVRSQSQSQSNVNVNVAAHFAWVSVDMYKERERERGKGSNADASASANTKRRARAGADADASDMDDESESEDEEDEDDDDRGQGAHTYGCGYKGGSGGTAGKSKSRFRFKGQCHISIVYTVGILFHVRWCIRLDRQL